MKKILSILFAVLILFSGLNFTISTHYCGGKIADSKISLSDQIATCGMEEEHGNTCSGGSKLSSSCCSNKITDYEIDSNYSPSFTDIHFFGQTVIQVFVIPENLTIHSLTTQHLQATDTSPPGNYLINEVSLPKICVFLI